MAAEGEKGACRQTSRVRTTRVWIGLRGKHALAFAAHSAVMKLTQCSLKEGFNLIKGKYSQALLHPHPLYTKRSYGAGAGAGASAGGDLHFAVLVGGTTCGGPRSRHSPGCSFSSNAFTSASRSGEYMCIKTLPMCSPPIRGIGQLALFDPPSPENPECAHEKASCCSTDC